MWVMGGEHGQHIGAHIISFHFIGVDLVEMMICKVVAMQYTFSLKQSSLTWYDIGFGEANSGFKCS